MAKPGRNEPCPCGSGRKHKECCLGKDEPPRLDHGLSQRCALALLDYARRRFDRSPVMEFHAELFESDEIPSEELGYVVPVGLYHAEEDGRSLLAWYLAEERPGEPERRFLEAQQEAWLSIWEVAGVEPGVSMTLSDLLTGTHRVVLERTASRLVDVRTALLGRVVAVGDHFELDGIHGRALPPMPAADAVAAARAFFRKRTRPVELAKLRTEDAALALTHLWTLAVEREDARPPPVLQNTDGDPLLFTRDVFACEAAHAEAVANALREGGGREDEEERGGRRTFVFEVPGNAMHPEWDNTIVGHAVLGKGRLTLETNSLRRADRLRKQVEGACGKLVRHRIREHSDPSSAAGAARTPPPRDPPRLGPDEEAVVREMKERHYRSWLDQPIPMLGGASPRKAAGDKRLRPKVEVLLKAIEHGESRESVAVRFDATILRRELGL
jgi:hypothetical protein